MLRRKETHAGKRFPCHRCCNLTLLSMPVPLTLYLPRTPDKLSTTSSSKDTVKMSSQTLSRLNGRHGGIRHCGLRTATENMIRHSGGPDPAQDSGGPGWPLCLGISVAAPLGTLSGNAPASPVSPPAGPYQIPSGMFQVQCLCDSSSRALALPGLHPLHQAGHSIPCCVRYYPRFVISSRARCHNRSQNMCCPVTKHTGRLKTDHLTLPAWGRICGDCLPQYHRDECQTSSTEFYESLLKHVNQLDQVRQDYDELHTLPGVMTNHLENLDA